MIRRGRKRGTSENVLTLDSLVDVVTNTNGMLILLAVFITLLAMGKTFQVGFPVARASGKRPVFFECSHNRVFLIGNGEEYSDNYELITIEGWRGTSTQIRLKDKNRGETPDDLQNPSSAFWKAVEAIDPDVQYAVFIVRPDSFEVFRAARDALRPTPIKVGWNPHKAEVPIRFRSGGHSVPEQ